MKIRKLVKNKLSSQTGATLMAALLLFVMCAVVGSVVLAAASSSAGRASRADLDGNKQRYALDSAAQWIMNDLASGSNAKESNLFTSTSDSVSIKQEWSIRHIKVSEVETINVGSLSGPDGDDGYYEITATANDNVAPETHTAGKWLATQGSYVLRLDSANIEPGMPGAVLKKGNHMDEEDKEDEDKVLEKNLWNGNGENGNYLSNSGVTVYIINGTGNSGADNTTNKFNSISQLRDTMVEAIYRNYWGTLSGYQQSGSEEVSNYNPDEIIGETATESETQWQYDFTTWNGNSKRDIANWRTFLSTNGFNKNTYVIESDGPLVIDVGESVYKVMVDVKMDSQFNLTFHLYCAEDGEEHDSFDEATMQELWLTYQADETKVTFNQSSTTNTESLKPFKITVTGFKFSFETEEAYSQADLEDMVREMVSGDFRIDKVTVEPVTNTTEQEVTNADGTKETQKITEVTGKSIITVEYSTIEEIPRSKISIETKRNAEFSTKWQAPVLTTVKPEEEVTETTTEGSDGGSSDGGSDGNTQQGSSETPAEGQNGEG